MVHKIHISPVKAMVAHWQGVFRRIGPIEFTSIIVRLITDTICLLDSSNPVQYNTTPMRHDNGRIFYSSTHAKERPKKLCYNDLLWPYTTKIPLPCERL